MMNKSLLLVDDEKNILSAMQRLLVNEDYEVFTATSGIEALDILAQHKVNLVISDQRMPGMTGSELLHRVRELYPDTIRIVLSGYADFTAVADAVNQGSIYKFLSKPWDDEVMLEHIREAFRRQELVRRNSPFTKVFENTSEGIIIAGANRAILSVNPAFCQITGFTLPEVVGRSLDALRSPERPAALYEEMWAALACEAQWNGESWSVRKNGEEYLQWLNMTAIHDRDGGISQYVALFADISERKKQEAFIEHQAYHDTLTGLPNRLLLGDRLEVALTRANREGGMVGVIFLDLDRFKNINDSLGHQAGDQLLIEVARRLGEAVRQDDTVARMSGDEFIIVLGLLRRGEEAAGVARKLQGIFSRPIVIDSRELFVTASIGIAMFPGDGADPHELLKNADTAMHKSKEQGGNGYSLYSPAMRGKAMQRLTLESALHRAIDGGELELYFQPQMSLASSTLSGMEALVRWHHPELGMISPDLFVPIAEDSGLIHPMGEWITREACRHYRQWQEVAGFTQPRLAINLSARQLQQPHLARFLERVTTETGVAPANLEIEITESVLMGNPEGNRATLSALKEMGFTIAMDDFGTGYSSLSYLRKLPLDYLKIDISFVQGLPESQESEAIVKAIIVMAHSLNLAVIAEGVETEAQLACLRGHGCDIIQGFYFSRPLPAMQMAALLAAPASATRRQAEGRDDALAKRDSMAARANPPGTQQEASDRRRFVTHRQGHPK